MKKENFNDSLTVRIMERDLNCFKNKSRSIGKPYQLMIRELVKAFNDGRIRIVPTDEQCENLKIYQIG